MCAVDAELLCTHHFFYFNTVVTLYLQVNYCTYYITPTVFFNLFVAAEPLQAMKSVAEPHVKSVRLCKLNVTINSIVAYTVCW